MAHRPLSSKDDLLCSICLDIFTHPVTAPCGHNFCRECITGHWNTRLDCPVCTRLFSTEPQLKNNNLLSQMVHQFRHPDSKGKKFQEEVLCDICSGTKVKAVKSCVECETSYCETHLKPHQRVRGLRGHWLFQPVDKKMELKRVQQFAVDLTLDPDTAHPVLILSEDGKQVHFSEWKNLPDDHPEIFNYVFVLVKESFSSGRFYFEVQVKGNTEWALGVVPEPISRKMLGCLSPRSGFWGIGLTNRNYYYAAGDPAITLSVTSPPQKVGVFVDYDEGLVSFYDADTADLLHFNARCTFIDQLRPIFFPSLCDGTINPPPLIICPVNQTS